MPTSTPFAADGLSVSTGNITVSSLLNQPRRITRDIAGVAAANYWLDTVLPNGGSTSGGAVVFDPATPNNEFLERDAQEVGELSRFPLLNAEEPNPQVAKVVKIGGKILVSDEKRDRNDIRFLNREMTKLANTAVSKVERVGMAALQTAISANLRTSPATEPWASVVSNGAGETPHTDWPHADVARARAAAAVAGAGADFDVMIIHPNDYVNLSVIYNGRPELVFGANGQGRFFQSIFATEHAPILAQAGQAGGTYWEKALDTETYREPEIEGTYVQTSGRMVHVVDNAYALLQITSA